MTKKKVFLANMYTKLFLAVALFTGMLYIVRYDYNLRTQRHGSPERRKAV